MKKKYYKSKSSDFDRDFGYNQTKKAGRIKDRSSKRKLSIYDDYDNNDDLYAGREKFKSRNK
ncbi:MAG: hypothetical protein CR996_01560 [Draconibacterium sp.]|nr:MAG: hypothetical protein CR996_01560 [Draconibacterium sp.]PIF06152.1 MAG: hypothetical protein CSA36_03085 [Draconibacterium sp.]